MLSFIRTHFKAGGQPARIAIFAVAALSGYFESLAFANEFFWGFSIIAVAFLYWAVKISKPLDAAIAFAVWHLSCYLFLFNFIEVSSLTAAWILLAAIESAFMMIAVLIYLRFRKGRPIIDSLLFALSYSAAEYVRSIIPFGGFPFGKIGYSISYTPLVNLAKIGGVELASFGFIFLCCILIELWKHPKIVLAAIPIALVCAAGSFITAENQRSITVAAVQGNIDKIAFGVDVDMDNVLQNHINETRSLFANQMENEKKIQLIAWPENSVEFDITNPKNAARLDSVINLSKELESPILIGSQVRIEETRLNRYILVDKNGLSDVYYDKRDPVPFGEYVPFRDLIQPIVDVDGLIPIDMIPGERANVIEFPIDGQNVRLGIYICFEVTDDALTYEMISGGAQAVLAPTNNVFFGFSSESFQQLSIARFKAIQMGKSLLQVSTMGISAGINLSGLLENQTELYQPASFVYDLELSDFQNSFVLIFEQILQYLLIAFIICAVIAAIAYKIKGDAPKNPDSSNI